MTTDKNKAAAELGRSTSEAKAAAARENGKKGGRPGSLDAYEERIAEILAIEVPQERFAALHLICNEIGRCAWTTPAQSRAAELVANTRSLIPDDFNVTDGIEALGNAGKLRLTRRP